MDIKALRQGLGLYQEQNTNASDLLRQYMSQPVQDTENNFRAANQDSRGRGKSSYHDFMSKQRNEVDVEDLDHYSARNNSWMGENSGKENLAEDYYATRQNMEIVDKSSLLYATNPVPQDLSFLKRR
jgi:hypothetical protein